MSYKNFMVDIVEHLCKSQSSWYLVIQKQFLKLDLILFVECRLNIRLRENLILINIGHYIKKLKLKTSQKSLLQNLNRKLKII